MLALAIVLISLALVAYTAGVWAEHRAGTLRSRHAALFAIGLVFDASGTAVMSRISGRGDLSGGPASEVLTRLMAVTGAAALLLMALHLTWAIVVLAGSKESSRLQFHRFSLAVWGLWLLPYFTGMAAAMMS